MKINFGKEEQQRYSRQVFFHGIGKEGQKKLAKSRVLILGCGGLGSVSSELITRAGIGYIKIIDRDFLELNNLQRQILFDENDVKQGLPKAIAAKQRLEKINSNVIIEAIVDDANRFNIETLLDNIDLAVDATDNFETRFLLNEACIKKSVPWIYGACIESYGLTMNIIPDKTPCLRCIFEKIPAPGSSPTCETVGVISPVVTTIASIQCTEALKILTANYNQLNNQIVSIDLWKNNFETIDISEANKQKNCPVCNFRQFNFLSGKYGTTFTTLCGRNAVQIIPFEKAEIDLKNLALKLTSFGDPIYTEYLLKITLDNYELTIFPDKRAIIKGTTDIGTARGIYTKFVDI